MWHCSMAGESTPLLHISGVALHLRGLVAARLLPCVGRQENRDRVKQGANNWYPNTRAFAMRTSQHQLRVMGVPCYSAPDRISGVPS